MGKVDRDNVENILELTPTQAGMLFHTLREPERGHYLVQLALRLRGPLQLEIFRRAWRRLAAANEMLRATFRWRELSEPVQILLKERAVEISQLDLSRGDLAANLELLEELEERDRQRGLDLERVPYRISLCKLGPDLHEVIILYHNIILDGWSIARLVEELLASYDALWTGREPRLAPRAPFVAFLEWRRERGGAGGEFWSRHLARAPRLPSLDDGFRGHGGRAGHGRSTHRLPAARRAALEGFARRHRVTPSTVLYAVWAVLLARTTGAEDVIFGTTVAGRPPQIPDIERTLGPFVDTPALRVALRPEDSFDDVLARVSRTLAERSHHEDIAGVELRRAAGLDPGAELFDTLVVVENYPIATGGGEQILTLESYTFEEAPHYDLTLVVRAFDDFQLDIFYRPERLGTPAVERLAAHFCNLSRACIERSTEAIAMLEMMGESERRQLHEMASGPCPEPLEQGTLDRWLEHAVERHGDRVAVVSRGGELTYGELWRRIGVLTQRLHALGVGPGRVVALWMERSPEALVALFAVLRAGGCYLPLATADPAARSRALLRQAGAELLIVHGREIPGLAPDLPVLDLANFDVSLPDGDLLAGSERFPEAPLPGDPAYLIFTSGSTGGPKGVVVPHRSVVNLLSWLQRTHGLAADDVVLASTPWTFDVSLWELFGWMAGGGRLALLASGEEKDPVAIVDAIMRHGVTSAHFVPSLLPAFLEHVETHDRTDALGSLRRVFLSGEALRGTVVERFWQVLGSHEDLRLFNLYGPTEATVWVSVRECERTLGGPDIVPIGRPIDKTRLVVLGRAGELLPVGAWGELYIVGAGVATGYHRRAELTAARFVRPVALGGERAYRTGDVVRWCHGGELEFKGRLDHQVKIRGHRVECSEVEGEMLAVDGLEEAVVVAVEGVGGSELHGYYVASRPISGETLRTALGRSLPSVMVPGCLEQAVSLPRTSSGKVDRKALAEMASGARRVAAGEGEALAPSPAEGGPATPEPSPFGTALDRSVARPDDADEPVDPVVVEVLADVLRLEPSDLGPEVNYFHLGCNSISAVRLTSALYRRLGVEIRLGTVFANPTPRRLSAAVRRARKGRFHDIPRVEERDFYELSFDQKRLWIIQELQQGTASYNLVGTLELPHAVRPEAVSAALDAVVRRHESLRTRFMTFEGRPVQRVQDQVAVPLRVEDLSVLDPGERERVRRRVRLAESKTPIDLGRAPLLRATLLVLAEQHHELVVNLPHIVADGWSLEVLRDDFERIFYAGGVDTLPPPPIQYRDFVAWQERLLADGETVARAERFWTPVLAGGAPEMVLPGDLPGAVGEGHRSAAYRAVLPSEGLERLRRWSRGRSHGLFLPQMAALQLTMAQITGQDDVVVGFAAAARQHESLAGVTGMFANTLLVRSTIDPGEKLATFCDGLQDQLTQALEHQSVPLELICDRLGVRFPRLAVFLNFLNLGHRPRQAVHDLVPRHIPEFQESKFPLHFCTRELTNGLEIVCDYDADSFRPVTIERVMKIYLGFLERVTGSGETSIQGLSRQGGARRLTRPAAAGA